MTARSEGMTRWWQEGCSVSFDDDDTGWPTGRETQAEISLGRDLSKRLRTMGCWLIADRTRFVDTHFQGGFMIVDRSLIVAGRDFDLTLPDVVEWVEKEERKHKQKGA